MQHLEYGGHSSQDIKTKQENYFIMTQVCMWSVAVIAAMTVSDEQELYPNT